MRLVSDKKQKLQRLAIKISHQNQAWSSKWNKSLLIVKKLESICKRLTKLLDNGKINRKSQKRIVL